MSFPDEVAWSPPHITWICWSYKFPTHRLPVDAGQVSVNGFCVTLHQRSSVPRSVCSLQLTLTAEVYNDDYPIAFGEGLGNFIRDSDLGHFFVCEPLSHQIFLVETSPTSSNTFYIGPLWNELCRENNFREGDTIIFEVQTNVPNSHIEFCFVTNMTSAL
ncbi:hypothetical protein ACSQ67_003350 [Phaseolus vulgaris]